MKTKRNNPLVFRIASRTRNLLLSQASGLRLLALSAVAITGNSSAATLQWDANGTGAGQTNGAGNWLGANLWWTGSANTTWASGDDATFGGANTAGGAVMLAGGTTVGAITFNQFTGTYTLGTVGTSNTITINSGITKNSNSANVTFISPLALGGTQTWTNNSTSALTVNDGTNSVINLGSHTLTFAGTGTFNIVRGNGITGSGGVIVDAAFLDLRGGGVQSTNTFSGGLTVQNGGEVLYFAQTGGAGGNNLGAGNVQLNGGVLSGYFNQGFTHALGSGAGQFRITGGESGFGVNGNMTVNLASTTSVQWGSANFNPSKFILGGTGRHNGGVTFVENIDLNAANRTITTPQATGSGTLTGNITNSGSTTAGLVKEGVGMLTLSGSANTYNGGTTISAGTLRFTRSSAMPSTGGVSVSSGATLYLDVGGANEFTNATSGAGSLGAALAATTFAGNSTLGIDIAGTNVTYAGVISNGGATNLSVTKLNGNNLTLTGANTYSGATSTNGGGILVATIGNTGLTSSPLGTNNTAIDFFGAGELEYTGAGETTNRLINISSGTAGTLRASTNTGAINFSANISPTSTSTGKVLTLTGTSTLSNTISGVISNGSVGTATLGITKALAGTWVLSGANTYTGVTSITTGTLVVNVLANGGTASSIGQSSNAAANLVFGAPSATLSYTGSTNATTNRAFTMSNGAGGGATIDSSGTGTITFNTPATTLAYGTAGETRTLTLSGTNTGSNTFGKVLANNGTAATSLVKAGSGKWVLGTANTYTGTTSINAGTLEMGANDVLPNASAVTIGSGTLNVATFTDTLGTLDVSAAANINVGTGGAVAFADSSAVDWTGGSLNITGSFVSGSSVRFGTSVGALTTDQKNAITVNGTGAGNYSLDADGFVVAGSAPVDPYATWSSGNIFASDANNDGVANGLAFLLGAASPTATATNLLPASSQASGNLTLTFTMLNAASRGTSTLALEHSSDLGVSDAWSSVTVPDTSGTVSGITFTVTPGSPLNTVTATIPASEAAAGKVFGRLKAQAP